MFYKKRIVAINYSDPRALKMLQKTGKLNNSSEQLPLPGGSPSCQIREPDVGKVFGREDVHDFRFIHYFVTQPNEQRRLNKMDTSSRLHQDPKRMANIRRHSQPMK